MKKMISMSLLISILMICFYCILGKEEKVEALKHRQVMVQKRKHFTVMEVGNDEMSIFPVKPPTLFEISLVSKN